jgi:hypothetical protein
VSRRSRCCLVRGVAALAAVGLLAASTAPPFMQESFQEYPVGTWAQGSTHGDWHVDYDGYGQVWIQEFSDGNKVLNLRPTTNPPSTGTSAALVTSVSTTSGDLTLAARMRTISQNAPQRVPAQTPQTWETAWLFWNHRTEPGSGDEGTGKAITEVEKSYYLALKPNGWELGKLDQARFLGLGGQRYLATGTSPQYPVGPDWRNVSIRQTQVDATRVSITVTVDGQELTTFVDGPGSGGLPAWSEHPDQEVYTSGRVGLYTEDARVQFDDITRTTSSRWPRNTPQ